MKYEIVLKQNNLTTYPLEVDRYEIHGNFLVLCVGANSTGINIKDYDGFTVKEIN